MASAAAAATPQPRGPLSHIVDALRLDNRQLLLETLSHDPRLGDVNDDHDHAGGADSAAGAGAGALHDDGGEQQNVAPTPPPPPTAAVVEQQLIFGSDDLRRVLLRQVMQQNNHRGSDGNKNKKKEKKKKKKSKNVTQDEEEEEIMKDLNEEMKQQQQQQQLSSLQYYHETKIVGTSVLSPLGDGSTIIAGKNDPSSTSSSSSNTNAANNANRGGFNPFGNSEDDSSAVDKMENLHVPITTYFLRGGGFDLPSLSAAALHRRKVLLANKNSNHRFHHHHNNRGGGASSTTQTATAALPERVFRFVFVPRMTEMERAFLNELGVVDDNDSTLGDINSSFIGNAAAGAAVSGAGLSINSLESLPIDLIPLDDDVLSLELTGGSSSSSTVTSAVSSSNNTMNESDKSGGGTSSVIPPASAACMRHSDIEGCEADVADIVARSLLKLQLLNRASSVVGDGSTDELRDGAIARVQGLGPLSTAVIDRMMTLRLEEERLEAQAEDEEEEEAGEVEMMESNEGMEQDEVVTNAADGVEISTSPNNKASSSGMDYKGGPSDVEPIYKPSIQALLVIDRKIDLVTPMLTPLTYEGLIDDVLQIQVGGCVSVKKSIVEPDDDVDIADRQQQQQQQQRHPTTIRSPSDDPTILVPLNDADPLYTEVRDRHVETFGSFLQNQAKALKESHSQFTNRETARDLTEIHQFVKQIPVFTRNLRSLTNHIHIAELVKSAAEATSFRQRWQTERSMLESEPCYEVLEDLIASGESPYRWLRLFCLQSLTSNGIKATRYDSLRREVVQTYGYEFLMVLSDLEKAGFLRKRETFFMDSMATPYSTLRKALNLINADVDPSNPQDAAYVSSGYAPMTVRWVEAAMRGYVGLDEALKELPAAGGVGVGSGGGGGGRWVDVEQRWPPESLVEALKRKRGLSLGALAKKWSEESRGGGGNNNDGSMVDNKPVLLVYFVGGVTFMELAALRFLSKRPSFPYNIVCCTTEIVNGGTLLRSLSC